MVLRQTETRRVADELAERDLLDVAALLELGHVLDDRLVERELAGVHHHRQQCHVEGLAQRGEIEQRVRGDRLARAVGLAKIVEQGPPVDPNGNGGTADSIVGQHLINFVDDGFLHLAVGDRPCRTSEDHERRDQRSLQQSRSHSLFFRFSLSHPAKPPGPIGQRNLKIVSSCDIATCK